MDDQRTDSERKYEQWLASTAEGLRSNQLSWSRYTQPSPTWDHDHCEFCFRRFAEPGAGYTDSTEFGYATPDRFDWVCKDCFDKYKDRFDLIATNESEDI